MIHVALTGAGQKLSSRLVALNRTFFALMFVAVAGLCCVAPKTAFAEAPLSRIVTPRIIGTTLKYAEFQIGSPAMLEWKDALGIQRNLYERGDCRVILGLRDEKVVSVSLDMIRSSACDIDAGPLSFDHLKGRRVTQTTINDWLWRGRPTFSDPSLPSCNACQETPIDVYALFEAVGVTGNLELQLGSDTAGKGHEKWRDMLYAAGVDGDKLPMNAENCPLQRFDAQALELMGTEHVSSIAIGQRGTLAPACSAAAIQRPREN
ncbi:hypothetical protein [Burkholderia cenocepacia]|uniref:hypothetical protein n=1 Tax=Burkholderia cenocepacia TaxID=95486 RepID=UPI00076D542E|nr:hypothetical protein [Burkholderia cenocepacia]KWU24759.1 hypothetical protein AS149_31945 [Burkholderia cenocepacia]